MKRAPVLAVSLLLFPVVARAAEDPPQATAETSTATDTPSATSLADTGRVRWGVNGQLGTFFPGPMVAFGVEGRVGWSFSSMLAGYVSIGSGVGLALGGSASSTGASVSVSALSHWYLGVNAELNLGDIFFVAAGPGIGRGGWGGITQGADSSGNVKQIVTAAGGWLPSLDARLGFGFGKRNPETGRRGGFTLGIDMRVLFAPDSAFVEQTTSGGSAGQEVRTSGLAVGIVPMLMLGYDSR